MSGHPGSAGGAWNLDAIILAPVPGPPEGDEPKDAPPPADEPPLFPDVQQAPPPPPWQPSTPPEPAVPPPPAIPPDVAEVPWPEAVPGPGSVPGRWRPGRRPVYAGIAVLAVVVATVLAVASRHGGSTAAGQTAALATTPPAAQQPFQPTDAGTTDGSPTDGGTRSAEPSEQPSTVDLEAAALGTLERLRGQDLGVVTFDGAYVAQLASKAVGIVDPLQTAANGTHTFYASDILAEHMLLRQGDNLGAQVILLLSTDYGHKQLYQGQALWVTFALDSFGSTAAATAWCTRRFPELTGPALDNQCTVRRLEQPSG